MGEASITAHEAVQGNVKHGNGEGMAEPNAMADKLFFTFLFCIMKFFWNAVISAKGD